MSRQLLVYRRVGIPVKSHSSPKVCEHAHSAGQAYWTDLIAAAAAYRSTTSSASSGAAPRGSAIRAEGPASAAILSGSRPGAMNHDATAIRRAPAARSDDTAAGTGGEAIDANAGRTPASGNRRAHEEATAATTALAGACEEPAPASTTPSDGSSRDTPADASRRRATVDNRSSGPSTPDT